MAPRTKRISGIMFVFLFQPQLGAASVHQSLVFQQDSSCKARRALAGHPREFLSLFGSTRLVLLVWLSSFGSARLVLLVWLGSSVWARLVGLVWFCSSGSARLVLLVWLGSFGSARLVGLICMGSFG